MIERAQGLLGAGAFVLGGLALALAAQHPVAPVLVLSAVFCWVVLTASFPTWWLFALPACLPWLNFAPWTGWRVVEEFDLLVLASLAGAYARWAWDGFLPANALGRHVALPKLPLYLLSALVLTTCVSAARGMAGWPGQGDVSFANWMFQDEHSPLSSLRIGKSLVFVVLLLPLWLRQVRQDGGTARVYSLFAHGMCAGLAVVASMALLERAAFPGWLNFSTHYRTTASFWEMHFGGAAIDIYLVASSPFAVWFLLAQKRPVRWLAAATLLVLALYAVLTTFSRGVYGAVLVPLLLLVVGRWVARQQQWWATLTQSLAQVKWRGRAGLVLVLLLMAELLTVVVGGTYMRERLADSETDLVQRVKHWQRGLALVQTPAEQLWGIGLGRLPARYAAQGQAQETKRQNADTQPVGTQHEVPTEFSGRAQVLADLPAGGQAGKSYLRLSGPATQAQLGGLFSVNQRLGSLQLQLPRRAESPRGQAALFGVVLQLRATPLQPLNPEAGPKQPNGPVTLLVKLCEKHLIYEGNCHLQAVKVLPLVALAGAPAGMGAWQTVRVGLRPYQNLPPEGVLRRSSSLSLSVVDAGRAVDIGSVQLWAPGGQIPLQNANFSAAMAHWLPGAGGYYLPWHIDNLYLELLIERGWLGLGAVFWLCAWALRCLWLSFRQQPGLSVTSAKPVAQYQQQDARQTSLVPYFAASFLGCALAGTVSSVLDAPRIGFLFFSLLFLCALAGYGDKKPQA